MAIRLALADDHTLFREGMRLVIGQFADVELVVEAAHGRELLEAIAPHPPDVVLLDLKMPVMDGVATTEILHERYPDVKILLLTLHDNERMVAHLMKLGAHGYLLKNETPDTLHRAIQTVHASGYYFSDFVSRALLAGVGMEVEPEIASAEATIISSISKREREVLQLVCEQYTTAEIAQRLFITPRTVEGHRKHLFEKTGVKNVVGLVVFALRNNLVKLS